MTHPQDEATRVCVICLRRQYLRAQACDPCRERLPHLIGEIADLYQRLVSPAEEIAEEWTVQNQLRLPVPTTNITRLPAWTSGPWTEQPGHDPVAAVLPMNAKPNSGGPRVTGSREAPVPVNLDLVDLTLPARAGSLLLISDPRKQPDQIGRHSVAGTLDFWVSDWRSIMPAKPANPVPTVAVLTAWLRDRCDWACDNHPAIDEFSFEMKRTRAILRGVLNLTDPPPQFCDGIVCKKCDHYALYRADAPYEAECDECGLLYTETEYFEWVALLAGQVKRIAA